jgi:Family of unknown function (DUF6533)
VKCECVNVSYNIYDSRSESWIHNHLHVVAICEPRIIFSKTEPYPSTAFLFYDHLITSGKDIDSKYVISDSSLLGNEIEYIWRRRKTHSAYWFLLTRYFAFFGNIVVAVLGYSLHPEVCYDSLLIAVYSLAYVSQRSEVLITPYRFSKEPHPVQLSTICPVSPADACA